jgi:hypothetical protein
VPASDRSALPIVRSVRIALGVGLALLLVAIALVLSESPARVLGSNDVPARERAAFVNGGFHTCQTVATLPRGTTAIRLSASANTGPRLTLTVRSRGRVIDTGRRGAGWGVTETVTVPITRVPQTVTGAQICLAFGEVIEPIQINGTPAHATGAVLLRFEYLSPSQESWWSRASSVAHRLGYGRVPSGIWVVIVVIALMIGVALLASRLVLDEMP